MRRSPALSRCLLLLAFPAVAILLSFGTVHAAAAPAKRNATFAALEREFHIDIQFMPADVADKAPIHAVPAGLSLDRALKTMLARSGLGFRICPASVVVIAAKGRIAPCPARPAAKTRANDSSAATVVSSAGVTAVIVVASVFQSAVALAMAWAFFEYFMARKRSRAVERGHLHARGQQSIDEGDLDFAINKLCYLLGGSIVAECAAIGVLRDVTFDPTHLPLAVWCAMLLISVTAARDIARRIAKQKETAQLQGADIGDPARRDGAIERVAVIHAAKTFLPHRKRTVQGDGALGRTIAGLANREPTPSHTADPN